MIEAEFKEFIGCPMIETEVHEVGRPVVVGEFGPGPCHPTWKLPQSEDQSGSNNL